MRVQRTCSSASPPHSPLTRYPLGGLIGVDLLSRGVFGVLIAVSIAAAGCLHTFTGATFYYPPGSHRDSSEYRVVMEFHGASGHAFSDRTEKTINLAIRSGDTTLLHRWYKLVAADLDAGVTWETADDLIVYFYEPSRGRSRTLPRHELLRLHFTRDGNSQQFVEAPLPPSAVEALKLSQQ